MVPPKILPALLVSLQNINGTHEFSPPDDLAQKALQGVEGCVMILAVAHRLMDHLMWSEQPDVQQRGDLRVKEN